MLDEGVPVLAAPAGETVQHRGEHVVVDDVLLGPARATATLLVCGPWRRPQAAPKGESLRGEPPLDMDADRYSRLIETVVAERGDLDGFDIALSTTPGEPVADYAVRRRPGRSTRPAVPDTDAVFEIVTTRPPD